MRYLAIASVAAVVGGIVLVVAGETALGLLVLLAGLAFGTALGAVTTFRMARDTYRDWRAIMADGGPQSIRLVKIVPPKGVIFNRDATVTIEVAGKDGLTKEISREVSVPPPQAMLWKYAGRIPSPIGGLAKREDLNVQIYRKRGSVA